MDKAISNPTSSNIVDQSDQSVEFNNHEKQVIPTSKTIEPRETIQKEELIDSNQEIDIDSEESRQLEKEKRKKTNKVAHLKKIAAAKEAKKLVDEQYEKELSLQLKEKLEYELELKNQQEIAEKEFKERSCNCSKKNCKNQQHLDEKKVEIISKFVEQNQINLDKVEPNKNLKKKKKNIKADPEILEEKEEMKVEEIASESQNKHSDEIDSKVESFQIPKNYRAPILSVLGHVDVGKTKLIEAILGNAISEERKSGDFISKHFSAKFLYYQRMKLELEKYNLSPKVEVNIPGMLIFDNPSNMSEFQVRNKGFGNSDFAILVVDVFHGIEKMTIDDLKFLKDKDIPFIVAVNKIDRIYGWKCYNNYPFQKTYSYQKDTSKKEFTQRIELIKSQLLEQGLQSELFYENNNALLWPPKISSPVINLVPTSSLSGEGISDLIYWITKQVQEIQSERLKIRENQFRGIILEKNHFFNLGIGVKVLLIDGKLSKGDNVVFGSIDGPVITTITNILSPSSSKDLKNYKTHESVVGTSSIGIYGADLEKAVLGTEIFPFEGDAEQQQFSDLAMKSLTSFKEKLKLHPDGIIIAATTPEHLEYLAQMCDEANIPISGINIGEVTENMVFEAMKPLMKSEGQVFEEYATIIAFLTKIDDEANTLASNNKVKIISENNMYNLIDLLKSHIKSIKTKRNGLCAKEAAIFPCILKITLVIMKKNPIILGVEVKEGIMRVGTPLCVVEKENLNIGYIESISKSNREITEATPRDGPIAIKIIGIASIMFGRHFDLNDTLVSVITRQSIDALKLYHRDDLKKEDWKTVIKLKSIFSIV